MAYVFTPVELPANRQSRIHLPGPDVYDPNYIPLLNGSDIKLDFSLPSSSPFPTSSAPPIERPAILLSRSKSSAAPERVLPELDAEPGHTRSVASPQITRHHGWQRPGSDDGQATHVSDDSPPSTIGTLSMLEDQVYTIPGNSVPPKDEVAFPSVATSSRSSIGSTRKAAVPTSKYNRKPVPGVPAMSSALVSKSQMPPESPRTGSVSRSAESRGPSIQPLSPPPMPAEPSSTPQIPKLSAVKSTASERRARALHSHPSNNALRSRRNSSLGSSDEPPLPSNPQHRARKSADSTRSRSTVYDSQQLTPAPTTPLPELPAHVKRPPTRERAAVAESHLIPASTAPPPRSNEHPEMANFMTTTNTVVFRRFDQVHVQLMLHLQDEIAVLERELLELENPVHNRPEKSSQRTSLMRELRRLLAEYDHLFANWNQMQANKASAKTREELEQWLQNPANGSETITKRAKEDLEMMQNSKDLSSLTLNAVKQPSPPPSVKTAGGRTGGGGGFAALFGCGGKRK